MNFILGIVASASAALSSVIDYFTRVDNANDLGSVSGQKWKIWRGAWAIVSNKASSSSAGSSNALATLKFTSTDVTVSISGADPGMGASFWVTDADNWYASVYTQTQVCQTCSNCNATSGGNCATWNASNCSQNATGNCSSGTFCCGTFNSSTCSANAQNGPANQFNNTPPVGFPFGPSRNWVCTSWNTSNCNANCCPGAFPFWSPHCVSYNTSNCQSTNPVVCNAFFTFSCNCVTEHRISLIRSISGTVSNVVNSLFSATIQSFKTLLSGNQATIQAFSTTTYNSQIGNSVVQSLTSPVKTKHHGIIKSTSSFQQGSTIDEFGVN